MQAMMPPRHADPVVPGLRAVRLSGTRPVLAGSGRYLPVGHLRGFARTRRSGTPHLG